MTEAEAREFFLQKIRTRLADEGHPLDEEEERYWQALRAPDEKSLDELLADKKRSKVFAGIEDRFGSALHSVIANDLATRIDAREQYISARRAITSADGIQLQALVFAASDSFPELNEPRAWWRSVLMVALVLGLLALGAWIGFHLRR
jgi:hypothetical protein